MQWLSGISAWDAEDAYMNVLRRLSGLWRLNNEKTLVRLYMDFFVYLSDPWIF